jgi:hypothetical protein
MGILPQADFLEGTSAKVEGPGAFVPHFTAVLQFLRSLNVLAKWRFLKENATERCRFRSTPIGEPL